MRKQKSERTGRSPIQEKTDYVQDVLNDGIKGAYVQGRVKEEIKGAYSRAKESKNVSSMEDAS